MSRNHRDAASEPSRSATPSRGASSWGTSQVLGFARLTIALASAALVGCVGAPTLDEASDFDARDESPQAIDATRAAVELGTRDRDGETFFTPRGGDQDTEHLRLLEKLFAPKPLPDFEPGEHPLTDTEATYGGCRVHCCTLSYQRIYDPVRGAPISVPVVTCQ